MKKIVVKEKSYKFALRIGKNNSPFSILHSQLFFLFFPCIVFAQYTDHRNRQVDSLEQILATHPPTGEDLGRIYNSLMWGYLQTDREKSMEYARKCVSVGISIDGWRGVSGGYRVLGLHFYGNSQYDSAIFYYDKALEATERMSDFPKKYSEQDIDDNKSNLYGTIGNLYNMRGMCPEAIEYYMKALKIFEKYDWKEPQTIAYNNIGQIYMSLHNFEQAKINLLKSDSLAHITGDSLMIVYTKYHLSCLYLLTNDYDKALQNIEIAYAYYLSHPEEEIWKVAALNQLSEIYLEGYGELARAEEYVRQALQILDIHDMPREKSISLRLLSSIHLKREQWRQAEQTALAALDTDDSELTNTLAIYEILAKVYAKFGDSDKAWTYFDKHNELRLSWSTKHYQSAIREMEVKYETEKKEIRIALLEDEKRLMTWLIIACGGILLLTLAALFFLWRWAVQKKRFSEQRIQQLEQEKQLIATQSLLDGETQERARLARDMHDGLGGMLSVLRLHLNEEKSSATLGKEDVVRFNQAIVMLDDSIEEMRRVAHHLMPDALSRYGLKIALTDFLNTLSAVEFNYFGSDCRIDRKLELVVYRIIYELVNNALKHASASQILVQLIQKTDSLALTVEDNGCGFDLEAATGGVGIHNIRTRVASFGGTLDMRSSQGKGTEVNIEFQL
ncbi:MAG: ATP-binding protein [Bacteroidales bacterium]|nr:ATP-binding protein [Bacteroidales bacterium]